MKLTGIYLLLAAMLSLASCGADNTQAIVQNDSSRTSHVQQAESQQAADQAQVSAEEEKIFAKIKAKIKRDYPEDYSIQLVLYNQEVADYNYMKTVSDQAIKKKVARDYPLDFSIQKVLYNQEIDAKEQMQ